MMSVIFLSLFFFFFSSSFAALNQQPFEDEDVS